MKKKIFLIIAILTLSRLLQASPVAGVSGISANTDRAVTLSQILEQHIIEILKKNNFSTIDPSVINRELARFNCLEEKCILKFAGNADIDFIIRGTVIDKKKFMLIKLQAFGINIPFNGRIINKYEIKIPLDVPITSREFSLISEEHAARFLAKALSVFVFPVKIRSDGGNFFLAEDLNINGRFSFYSKDRENSVKETGEADITAGRLSVIRGAIQPGESFILLPYKNKSKEIDQFYASRKRDIVFKKSSLYDTLFLFAVMPAASASMPFASPFLGYYKNNDWSGLGLWMINAPPYIYMEVQGFLNSPDRLKEKHDNITRDRRAMNSFAWYMLLAGGMPLFIDSYTYDYIHQLSYFTGNNELLGNTATAAMLSATSNGAGLFYRGERFWGYFYFHLNNVLLYMTIREFSVPEYYDQTSGAYKKGHRNMNRGIAYCSLFALSKTVEIIHAITGREDLSSGEEPDEYVIPAPIFTLDEKGKPVFGFNVTLKF